MIVYVLPSVGCFGGVKVGFQFAEILRSCGVPVVMATPGGAAPQWFPCSIPVVERESVVPRLGSDDVALFSLPQDHAELARTDATLVLHCQGTDPRIDPVIADERVAVLTCWRQARDYVVEHCSRHPIEVGISISEVFGSTKITRRPRSIAYMPRRGRVDVVAEHSIRCGYELIAIDGDDEGSVAMKMASAEVFAATAEGEWFGLPALEAMASGCAVVSVPVLGGSEYLVDGTNCFVRPIDGFGEAIDALVGSHGAPVRDGFLRAAPVTVSSYRRAAQRKIVVDALEGPLGALLR